MSIFDQNLNSQNNPYKTSENG